MKRILYLISFLLSCLSAQAGYVTLTWDAPITNTGGTPLTDLGGYKIYYWQMDPTRALSIDVGNQTTDIIRALTDGKTYNFAATAYDKAANESEMSNIVSAFVQDASPFSEEALGAAVLPSSRSTQLDQPVAVFATIINPGSSTATDCAINASTEVPAEFFYSASDPATNALTGKPNTPVSIPAGQAQSFVISFTPDDIFDPTRVALRFECVNKKTAPVVQGVNTLLLSASETPVPDIVAIAATAGGIPGVVDIPGASGSAAFVVATVNVGAGGGISTSVDTGDLSLSAAVCKTDPQSSLCMDTPDITATSQTGPGTTLTFAIFLVADGIVPFDPAHNRVFVYFKDSDGIDRGSTSVAVRTHAGARR